MEHLPQPSAGSRLDAASSPLSSGTVLLGNLHDGIPWGPFEEYPARRGISREQLQRGDLSLEQARQAAALVQNWLFFGLLEEAFQTSVPTADFTQNAEGVGLVLSTRRLPEYLERWERRVMGQIESETERAKWAARLRAVYREAVRFFQLLCVGSLLARYPHRFIDYLNPLAVLVETLQCHTTRIFSDGAEIEPLIAFLSPAAKQELIYQGWCPFTITHVLLPSGSPSLLEYARSFGHPPSFIEQNHGNCTENDCTLATVDPATYRMKHRQGWCVGEAQCETLTADMEVVRAQLRSGRVPVVSYTENQGLITVGAEDDEYVAISHVWADGMGSTSEQGLPECQVKFLSEAGTAAYHSIRDGEDDEKDNRTQVAIPFWIDALSVPEEPALRKEAIVLMSDTYAAAAAVLVVDASMQRLSVTDSIIEQLLVLYVSAWVRRMWTLPEALLSRQLFFRIGDGLMDYRVFFRADNLVARTFSDPVGALLLAWFTRMLVIPVSRNALRLGASAELPQPSVDDVALHLAKRWSSRPEDETLAVAALFNLNVRPYLALDPDNRMAMFLTEHNGGKVPSDILFLDGKKLPFEGYGWAPQTFMKRQLAIDMKGTGMGVMSYITEQGLVGEYYGITIDHGREEDKDEENDNNNDRAGRDYKLLVDESETFIAIFNRSVDLDENVPEYAILLLPRPVKKGEEVLAAGVQPLESFEVEGEDFLRVELVCYVHVFHEDCIDAFNILPQTRHGSTSSRIYLIS
ncbi:hypothetical protein MMC21_007178 [Puttea exsequens]|nr:hypothetical protein [Puttea exsequens]